MPGEIERGKEVKERRSRMVRGTSDVVHAIGLYLWCGRRAISSAAWYKENEAWKMLMEKK